MRRLLLLFLLADAACADCWVAPVLGAGVTLALEGNDPKRTRASYGVTLGELRGCDDPLDDHSDVDDDTFTPFEARAVSIQPAGAAPIQLAETGPGRYESTGEGLAESYRVLADGEGLLIPAPPFFTAEVTLAPELVVTWSNDWSNTSVTVREAGGVGWPGTVDGQRATFDPRAIETPGDYTAVIERRDSGQTDPDDARVSASSHMTRTIPFTVD